MDLRKNHILGMALALAAMVFVADTSATVHKSGRPPRRAADSVQATPLARSMASRFAPSLFKEVSAPKVRKSSLRASYAPSLTSMAPATWQESPPTTSGFLTSSETFGTTVTEGMLAQSSIFRQSAAPQPQDEVLVGKARWEAVKVFASVFEDAAEDCQSSIHRSLLQNALVILTDLNPVFSAAFEAISQLIGTEGLAKRSNFELIQDTIAKQIFSMDEADARAFKTKFEAEIDESLPDLEVLQKSQFAGIIGVDPSQFDLTYANTHGRRFLRELLSSLKEWFAVHKSPWYSLNDDLLAETMDPEEMHEKMQKFHFAAYQPALREKEDFYNSLLTEAFAAYDQLPSLADQKEVLRAARNTVEWTARARDLVAPSELSENPAAQQQHVRDALMVLHDLKIPERPGEAYDAEKNHFYVRGMDDLVSGKVAFAERGDLSLATVRDTLVQALVDLQVSDAHLTSGGHFGNFKEHLAQRQHVRAVLANIPDVIAKLDVSQVQEYIALHKALRFKENTEFTEICKLQSFPQQFDMDKKREVFAQRFKSIRDDNRRLRLASRYIQAMLGTGTPQ